MEKFPQPKSPEQIETEISKLLEDLDGYSEFFDGLSEELQEAWYYAEMEAKVGKNREQAKEEIERFLKVLKEQSPG